MEACTYVPHCFQVNWILSTIASGRPKLAVATTAANPNKRWANSKLFHNKLTLWHLLCICFSLFVYSLALLSNQLRALHFTVFFFLLSINEQQWIRIIGFDPYLFESDGYKYRFNLFSYSSFTWTCCSMLCVFLPHVLHLSSLSDWVSFFFFFVLFGYLLGWVIFPSSTALLLLRFFFFFLFLYFLAGCLFIWHT